MVASSDKVVVIGGGIGGLSAALALLRRGLDVEVYEQSPELKEVGAGIQVSSNGSRVLYAWGLEQALARVQVTPTGREIRHYGTGETWNWFTLGAASIRRYGTPHLMLHRGDLHGILADAVRDLKADAIQLGRRCVAIAQSGERVEARFDSGEAVQRRVRARRRRDPLERAREPVRRRCSRIHRRASRGAASSRWIGCRRTSHARSAPTGSGRAAMCCTIRCGAAS